MSPEAPRVAFFPDCYYEIDGVGNTSRRLEAFAKERGLPFLTVHGGERNEIVTSGSVTRVQLERGPLRFALEPAHDYDLLFIRHYERAAALVRDFRPDLVQITGPSDVGTLGAVVAGKQSIPLAATFQTNLHQFARMRAAAALHFLPQNWSAKVLPAVEHWSLEAVVRFYQLPRLLFAPNQELIRLLENRTARPCFLMSHGVDTQAFRPEFRDRQAGPFRIGYVGRLSAEKSVRWLARLEEALLAKGFEDFEIVMVGDGAERGWLGQNMRKAQFTGVLTGADLSHAFANMDVFAFPSQTDTFGLVVLEAMASGVPAVVTASGGPKYSVQHGKSGYVAGSFDEFVASVASLITQPELLTSMRLAARQHALGASWNRIFEGMYQAYESVLLPSGSVPAVETACGRAGDVSPNPD